jgi:beta-mannosidase
MLILGGNWKATDRITTDLSFTRLDYDDSGWRDIPVPSHWQTCPGFERYPEKVIFRRRFAAAKPVHGRRSFIRFNGVFYFCRAWLNGVYLGEHTGAFDPFEFEITNCLRDGDNTLAVFVRCEIERDKKEKRQALGVFAIWDCKPDDIQPGGIWNSVELFETGPYRLKELRIGEFKISDDTATALVRAGICPQPGGATDDLKILYEIVPENFAGTHAESEFLLSGCADGADAAEPAFEVSIPDAQLWWPVGNGAQPLYRINARLARGGEILDSASARFGIRTVEFNDWILHVNGKKVFCRGSNYAPCDIRIADASRDDYERDADLMCGANLNMIRIHAHIEKPEFYDVCDERGIMVWQDFPLQWFYSHEVEETAVVQAGAMARHLMNHPSIAVWCCHNEPGKIPEARSARDLLDVNRLQDFIAVTIASWGPNWNKDELDPKIEKSILAVDRGRPVIRHSGVTGLHSDGTDTHLYFGWYIGTMRMLKSLASMYGRYFRFFTEYGAQAYPNLDSFKKLQNVASTGDIDWNEMERKYMLQRRIMEKFVPMRKGGGLQDYIEVSQWYQARLIKYHNEFLRSRKYDPCGGALHFMFNDCCPSVTWSVLDYWRAPKKGYEALRDSFRPLLVMCEFPKRWYPCGEALGFKIFVVNDLYQKHDGATVRWAVCDGAGNCLGEGLKTIDIPEDGISRAGRIRWNSADSPPGGYAIVLELRTADSAAPIINQYEFELRK